MTSPRKIFLVFSGVSFTLWSKPKSIKLLLDAENKVEFFNLSIFFIKIHDFLYFFSLGNWPLVSLLRSWSGGCTATHLKNFQWGGHDSFFRSYLQSTKKVTYFQSHFLVFILSYFTKHFIPTSDFYTTFSHSYF